MSTCGISYSLDIFDGKRDWLSLQWRNGDSFIDGYMSPGICPTPRGTSQSQVFMENGWWGWETKKDPKQRWEPDYLVALEGQEFSNFLLFVPPHNQVAPLLFHMLLGSYFLVFPASPSSADPSFLLSVAFAALGFCWKSLSSVSFPPSNSSLSLPLFLLSQISGDRTRVVSLSPWSLLGLTFVSGTQSGCSWLALLE